MKKLMIMLLTIALVFTGCGLNDAKNNEEAVQNTIPTEVEQPLETPQDDAVKEWQKQIEGKSFEELLGSGMIDTVPYKLGDDVSAFKADYPDAEAIPYQASMVYSSSTCMVFEEISSGKITAIAFAEGGSLYGFTIGDQKDVIIAKLGTNYIGSETASDADELAPSEAVSSLSYNSSSYELLMYFNSANESLAAYILAR